MSCWQAARGHKPWQRALVASTRCPAILTRNAFLVAAAPNRVTEQFGYVGAVFLQRNLHIRLCDWDGGDLLDIVGNDWVGWQDDTLAQADVVVHLVGGGFTEQRIMACERMVRESFRVNPNALQVTVTPIEQDLSGYSPGLLQTLKKERIKLCEDMVAQNCVNSVCLRLEAYRVEQGSNQILDAILKKD